MPAAVSWEAAAAFTLATLTAWRMIVTRARVQPGETVLIWGIGGGVAIAALQIAKRIGARVWAISSSDAKLARARELGADETFNHRTTDIVERDSRANRQARRQRRRSTMWARRRGSARSACSAAAAGS